MGRCAQGIRAKASCRKESGDVMAKKNVAAVLVDTLVAGGVKRIYCLAGDSLNAITDSIRTRETI
jgi:hypothetical protein